MRLYEQAGSVGSKLDTDNKENKEIIIERYNSIFFWLCVGG